MWSSNEPSRDPGRVEIGWPCSHSYTILHYITLYYTILCKLLQERKQDSKCLDLMEAIQGDESKVTFRQSFVSGYIEPQFPQTIV